MGRGPTGTSHRRYFISLVLKEDKSARLIEKRWKFWIEPQQQICRKDIPRAKNFLIKMVVVEVIGTFYFILEHRDEMKFDASETGSTLLLPDWGFRDQ